MKKNSKKIAVRVAVDGIFAAVAVALSFLESIIPPLPILPPGAKLGLGNVAVMFITMNVGYLDGFFIILIKSLFVFLTRGFSSFLMSFFGAVLSYGALCLILYISKKAKKALSYIFLSVVSACMHNIGQLVTASIYSRTNLVYYLPALLIFGVLSGIVTGIVLGIVIPAVNKIKKQE